MHSSTRMEQVDEPDKGQGKGRNKPHLIHLLVYSSKSVGHEGSALLVRIIQCKNTKRERLFKPGETRNLILVLLRTIVHRTRGRAESRGKEEEQGQVVGGRGCRP